MASMHPTSIVLNQVQNVREDTGFRVFSSTEGLARAVDFNLGLGTAPTKTSFI